LYEVEKKSKKEYRIKTSEAIPGEQCICPDNDLLLEKNKDNSVKISLIGKTRLL